MTSKRVFFAAAACVGLLAAWFMTPKPTPYSDREMESASAEAPAPAAARDRGVLVMDREDVRQTMQAAQPQAPLVPPAAHVPAPFTFLGKVDQDGETIVLLYRSGRTLKVTGAGPVAEDYVVDAVLQNQLLLRHVASGTQQIIEFTARDTEAPVSYFPEETPRD
jgi:hypothetical protein